MPDEVVVNKGELLSVLRHNRAGHREVFLKAQEGFRDRAIAELDRSLADARAGRDVRLIVHLPKPEDHTEDYDREIRMLEMHTEPTVKIRAPLFVIHGRNDPRVPVSEAEQLVAHLRSRGIRCELRIYEDEGHGLARLSNRLDAYPAAVAFLRDVLGD